MLVKLVWTTPDGDNLITHMARISNPDNQNNKDSSSKLLAYLINHKHWSPFEMVHACVEIETTRDIAHQILRHRSFSFQEFSQRYAKVNQEEPVLREARLQDTKNRQNSLELKDELSTDDEDSVNVMWNKAQQSVWDTAYLNYQEMLKLVIAKEVARAVLPEGLVKTRMYMSGSMRSWLHYWDVRCSPETQKEHRLVAEGTREIILAEYPQLKEVIENA